MAGIIAVYSLVISVLIAGALDPDKQMALSDSANYLAAGLSVGGSGLAAGYAIGVVGDTVGSTFHMSHANCTGLLLIMC